MYDLMFYYYIIISLNYEVLTNPQRGMFSLAMPV